MTPESPDPLSPLAHLDWAHGIARRVALAKGIPLGSSSLDDIKSVANLEMIRVLRDNYDPAHAKNGDVVGSFRGYAEEFVVKAAEREVERLKNGGTFNTARPGKRAQVSVLGDTAPAVADHSHASAAADPFTRIKINNTVYALPFDRLYRPLTGRQLEEFAANIEANGIQVPVKTCSLPDLGRAVIDGGHRSRIAMDKGLWVPVDDIGLVTWETARELAEDLNYHRRHLTDAEVKACDLERRARIVVARQSGASLRKIAAAEGLKHPEQVRRELDADTREGQTVTSVTPSGPVTREPKPPPTPAKLAELAHRGLKIAFGNLRRLLAADRERVVRLAEELDIPFEDDRPGHEDWPALTTLTTMSGLLARVG